MISVHTYIVSTGLKGFGGGGATVLLDTNVELQMYTIQYINIIHYTHDNIVILYSSKLNNHSIEGGTYTHGCLTGGSNCVRRNICV